MRKLYLALVLMIFTFHSVEIIAQDSADPDVSDQAAQPPEGEANSSESDAAVSENEADRQKLTPDQITLRTIEGDLAKYLFSSNDTSAQQARRKQKFEQIAVARNRAYSGKPISFQRLCVVDVEPETDLTPYGHKKAKQIIAQLRRDPQSRAALDAMGTTMSDNPILAFTVGLQLIMCKKCFRATGRYDVKFSFPEGESGSDAGAECDHLSGAYGSQVEITIASESKAHSYSKGQAYPVTGTIKAIKFEEGGDKVKTLIFLK